MSQYSCRVEEEDVTEHQVHEVVVVPASLYRAIQTIVEHTRLTNEEIAGLISLHQKGYPLTLNDEKYAVICQIDEGGFGVIYGGYQKSPQRPVAIKAISMGHSPKGRQIAKVRAEREAKYAAEVSQDNANFVAVYEGWEAKRESQDKLYGDIFMAMEYVDHPTLDQWIEGNGPLSVELALGITRNLAGALMHAHNKNIVHRDIKPANIFYCGENERIKIFDFGLARRVGRNIPALEAFEKTMTHSEATVGTTTYMSPEQFESPKEVDAAADRYSLGITLLHMLNGESPFSDCRTNLAIARAHLERNDQLFPEERLGHISSQARNRLRVLFQRLTAINPADRISSDEEIIDGIDEIKEMLVSA